MISVAEWLAGWTKKLDTGVRFPTGSQLKLQLVMQRWVITYLGTVASNASLDRILGRWRHLPWTGLKISCFIQTMSGLSLDIHVRHNILPFINMDMIKFVHLALIRQPTTIIREIGRFYVKGLFQLTLKLKDGKVMPELKLLHFTFH